mgnify:CR=1 FL=1
MKSSGKKKENKKTNKKEDSSELIFNSNLHQESLDKIDALVEKMTAENMILKKLLKEIKKLEQERKKKK